MFDKTIIDVCFLKSRHAISYASILGVDEDIVIFIIN